MDPLGTGVSDLKSLFVSKMRVKLENLWEDGQQDSAGVLGTRERKNIVMR